MIIPYTFQANTTIEPSQVNDNFIAVNNALQSQDTVIQNFKTQTNQQLNNFFSEVRSNLPIGSIIAWGTATIPNHYIAMIGQSISGYTELCEVLGKNTLPDTRNKVLWGSVTNLLEVLEEELPDHKHLIGYAQTTHSGTSSNYWVRNYNAGNGNFSTSYASTNNSTYKTNGVVRPASVTSVFIIKYE